MKYFFLNLVMIETNEQIALVRKLDDLKRKILKSYDRETIALYIREIIKLATPVPPCISERLQNYYKKESKKFVLALLETDMNCVENETYPDWETVHFQAACSIASLMLVFVDGGISRIEELTSAAIEQ